MSLDFDRVILAHSAWKTKLNAYMRAPAGSLSAQEAGDADGCRLGRWLAAEGQDFAGRPEFDRLDEVHREFHRCSADVITQIDAGKTDEAALLGPRSDYSRAARAMVEALKRMRALVQ